MSTRVHQADEAAGQTAATVPGAPLTPSATASQHHAAAASASPSPAAAAAATPSPPARPARTQQEAAATPAHGGDTRDTFAATHHTTQPGTSLMLVPAAVLAHCVGAALTDAEANQLARTCRHMLHSLADYRVKRAVYIEGAVSFSQTEEGAAAMVVGPPSSVTLTSGAPLVRRQWRFGLPVCVTIDSEEELASRMLRLPSSVRTIRTSLCFNSAVSHLQWPRWLTSLTFGWRFNQPIAALVLPPSLCDLTLGRDFNQSVDALRLPLTLRSLTFGADFNQPLAQLQLPDSLTHIGLPDNFNQPLSDWSPPAALTTLTLDANFSQPAVQFTLPPALHCLTLSDKWSIRGLRWPATLQHLAFRKYYARLLPGDLPPSLTHLDLGDYRGPLPDLTLLPQCTSLRMPAWFKQTLVGVPWPPALERLTLGFAFNQSLVGVQWPPALERLVLGDAFAQLLPAGSLPDTLTELSFNVRNGEIYEDGVSHWNLPVTQLALPPRLRVLRLGRDFDQPVDELLLPSTLEVLQFVGIRHPSVASLRLPAALRELHLGFRFSHPLSSLQLPASLRLLTFGTPTDGHSFPLRASALPLLPRAPNASLRYIGHKR